MKYISILKDWLKKPRKFIEELELGLALLVSLLLIFKILGRLILGSTFIYLSTIIIVVIIFLIISCLIRFIQLKIDK